VTTYDHLSVVMLRSSAFETAAECAKEPHDTQGACHAAR
jgi:hypothetical protein